MDSVAVGKEVALEWASLPLLEVLGAPPAREVLLAVMTDRVARIAVSDDELRQIAPILLELGLRAARSSQRFVPRRDRGKGGFSNRFASRHPQRHPEARWLLYLARDADRAASAQRVEEEGFADELGLTLHYPRCCVDWYESNWSLANHKHQGDLFPLSNANTDALLTGHPLLNFGANYFGGGWASFFPCSLVCKSAVEAIASERALIVDASPPLAALMDRQSALPILYTEFRGVAQLHSSSVDCQTGLLHYNPMEITITVDQPRGPLWRNLLAGDALRSLEVGGFDVLRGGRVIHRERTPDSFVRHFDSF